jgi:hypothetical protein
MRLFRKPLQQFVAIMVLLAINFYFGLKVLWGSIHVVPIMIFMLGVSCFAILLMKSFIDWLSNQSWNSKTGI